MRRMLVGFAMAVWAATGQAGIVNDFGDILFWAGSGTNQAGLVLDFGTAAPQPAPQTVAWGYRWNGAANLDDMVFALTGVISGANVPAPAAGSDPRLGIAATYYTSFQSYFIAAITYDQVGLPAGWSQQVRSLENDFDTDRGIAQFEAPAAGGTWPQNGTLVVSAVGPADTALAAGGWYGYVVAPYDPTTFEYPATVSFYQPTAAIPEPSAGAIAVVGLMALGSRLRRRRRWTTLPVSGLPSASPGPPVPRPA